MFWQVKYESYSEIDWVESSCPCEHDRGRCHQDKFLCVLNGKYLNILEYLSIKDQKEASRINWPVCNLYISSTHLPSVEGNSVCCGAATIAVGSSGCITTSVPSPPGESRRTAPEESVANAESASEGCHAFRLGSHMCMHTYIHTYINTHRTIPYRTVP